jgi:hypothetical protein
VQIRPTQIQQAGATTGQVLFWNGTGWSPGAAGSVGPHTHVESDVTSLVADLAAKLVKANNLSDVASATTSLSNLGGVAKSTLTAKGALFVASASGVVTQILVGSDGQVLTADSTQTLGVKWAAVSGGGGGGTSFSTARDNLTAAGGEVTWIPATAPLDSNNPIIWKNGTVLWPGVDYTWSSGRALFSSPLSAADVIRVWYQTTGTPAAGSLGSAVNPAAAITSTSSYAGAAYATRSY